MAIEIIPPGSSAVVTDRHGHVHGYDRGRDRDCDRLGETIKDAEARLQFAQGEHYADTVKTIKDTEADLARGTGEAYADTVKTMKDVQAVLDGRNGDRYADTLRTVKDAEAQLDRSGADRFMQTIQDIKDAESRLDRSSGDRFIQTVQDIKNAELRSNKNNEDRFARLTDDVRDFQLQAERSEGHSREWTARQFQDAAAQDDRHFEWVRDKIAHLTERSLVEFKEAQGLAYKLNAATEKTLDRNLLQNMLGFKDQALLSEKIAANASRELAECCCEIREAIGADGQKTRDLINSQEVDRLRDRAAKAEAGLAAYFSAKVAPVVPVL